MGAALFALAACASDTPDEKAAERTELDTEATAALNKLLAEDPAAKVLADKANGIAIFPSILKGGVIVGAESGDGVLRTGDVVVAYYNVSSASVGLQLGVQSYSEVLMFMTAEALTDFQTASGWEAGVDGSITVISKGASGQIDTSTISDPIIAFIFGEEGLMADVAIEGSKYTRLDL
jgi:lipid-binding SYLF domain-containing protein